MTVEELRVELARCERLLDERPLLSPAAAAQRLAISRSKLYGLIRDGQLRAVMVGQAMRIEPAEMDRYLAGLRGDHGG